MDSAIASAAAVSGGKASSYCLRWNTFSDHLTKGLATMLEEDEFTDVTLACNGQFLKAHKILLSLCSPFLKRLFKDNDLGKKGTTIVILNNVRFQDLQYIIRFIYQGEVNVQQGDLEKFLKTAELLQIEGLAQQHEGAAARKDEQSDASPALLNSRPLIVEAGIQPQPVKSVDTNQSSQQFNNPVSSGQSKRTRLSTSVSSRLQSLLTGESYVSDETSTIADNSSGCLGGSSYPTTMPDTIKDEYSENGTFMCTDGVEIMEQNLYPEQFHDTEDQDFDYEETANSSEEFTEHFTSDETSTNRIESSRSQSPKDSNSILPTSLKRKNDLGSVSLPLPGFSRDQLRKPVSQERDESMSQNIAKPDRQPPPHSSSMQLVHRHQQLEFDHNQIETRRHLIPSILGLGHHYNRNSMRDQYQSDSEACASRTLVSILQGPTIAEEEGKAQCPECLKFYKNRSSLKVHKSVYHRKGISNNGTALN